MNRITHVLRAAMFGALALGAFAASAQAQSWPSRPVKFVLPLGAGSGADIGARLFAEKLSAKWGQPVVVENRPGGDGFVAITTFTGAKDDHVFLWGPAAAFTAHPYLHEKLPYDPNDLSPVARVTTTIVSMSVPPTLNINSMNDLIARAKAEPGKLNWATVTGATDFVFAGWLKMDGLDMAKVPYRDPVTALNDLSENRIQVFNSAYAIVRAQAEAGRVKVLAVTNRERAEAIPNIPTVVEAGAPGLLFDGLVGLYGTRDLPNEIRERIAADIKEIAADPAIRARIIATGQGVTPGTHVELAAAIAEQRRGLEAAAKALGAKAAK
ncbi:MAG: tripartite tricarboxylate transporter substrate binding protein [Pseudomonadota bacterium]